MKSVKDVKINVTYPWCTKRVASLLVWHMHSRYTGTLDSVQIFGLLMKSVQTLTDWEGDEIYVTNTIVCVDA